jgi:RNA polymerase sigma-70 factor (ECF subfamily)
VGAVLGKSAVACRQIVARARRRLGGGPPRAPLAASEQGRRGGAFFAALREERVEAVMALLAEDAEMVSDGGGRAVAARRVVRGRSRVARFLVGVFRKLAVRPHAAIVNGRPGLVAARGDRAVATFSLDLDAAGLVRAVYVVRNPDKLARVPPVPA